MGLLDRLRDTITGDGKPKQFEVTFHEAKLGMTLSSGSEGEALVTAVLNGGAAAKAQVRPNDVVNSINGNPCPVYESLIEIIGGVGRPIVLGFFRPGSGSGTDSGGKGQSAVGQPAGGHGRWPLQRPEDAEKRKKVTRASPPPPPAMSEKEKAQRREAALKAAESRTQNWDRRRNKGRQATQAKSLTNDAGESKFEDSTNEETRRMVKLAKEQERRTAASMGYNPYEAKMMGNNVARAAIGGGETGGGVSIADGDTSSQAQEKARQSWGSNHRLGGTTPAGRKKGEDDFSGEDAALVETFAREVEEALGTVLEQGYGISLTAVQTMLKMMKNMAANASEDKFKRVRLGNANFHSKVGSVDGGLEVMTAAGFRLETNGEDPVLQHGSCDPVPLKLRVAIRKLAQAEAMLIGGAA